MSYQTAAILVIGNEVLSGRTREANAYDAAKKLFIAGCKLSEVSVVPDEREAIISTLNRLRQQYDAVITSGGIGPTHDDITMACVAEAFGVGLDEDGSVLSLMRERYGEAGLNDGRRRMASVPSGSSLVLSDKTIAPGAHIGNVYVLAGVPDIFASQLDGIMEHFGNGRPYLRREIEVTLPESLFAQVLSEIQQQFADVEIGSYPSRCGNQPCGKICLTSQNEDRLKQVEAVIASALEALR